MALNNSLFFVRCCIFTFVCYSNVVEEIVVLYRLVALFLILHKVLFVLLAGIYILLVL